jgi:hypothetical protein
MFSDTQQMLGYIATLLFLFGCVASWLYHVRQRDRGKWDKRSEFEKRGF